MTHHLPLKAHLLNLRYVLVHKYHVLRAGRWLGLGWWRLIKHDYTKFSRIEWYAYTNRFFGPSAYTPEPHTKGYSHRPGNDPVFDVAWEHHWMHPANEHHWNQFVDPLTKIPSPMPGHAATEMVADWYAAGMAQIAQGTAQADDLGRPDTWDWYDTGIAKGRLNLHLATKAVVEWALYELQRQGRIPARKGAQGYE